MDIKVYTDGKGFDVIFNTVGNENLSDSFNAVAAYGTVVTTIAMTPANLSQLHLKAANIQVVLLAIPVVNHIEERRAQFGANITCISTWFKEGLMQVYVDPQQFRFEAVVAAHQ